MPTVKTDLRIYKNNLREKYKKIRKNLSCEKKSVFDNKIFERIISLRYYKECNTVLTYVSNSIEVDTHRLIEYSLSCGKLVRNNFV